MVQVLYILTPEVSNILKLQSGSHLQCTKRQSSQNDIYQRYEPRCEKTSLRGFRPGPTRTGLYNRKRLRLEMSDLSSRGIVLSE